MRIKNPTDFLTGLLFGGFGLCMSLYAATVLLVIASAAGGHEFRWREVLALAAGLAVFAVAVFVYGLGLPFPLWPELLS